MKRLGAVLVAVAAVFRLGRKRQRPARSSAEPRLAAPIAPEHPIEPTDQAALEVEPRESQAAVATVEIPATRRVPDTDREDDARNGTPVAGVAPSPQRPSHSPWGAVATILILLLVLGAAALAQTSRGKKILRQVGISAPSRHYTALSFSDPSGLPAPDQPGPSQQSVSFTIHNAGVNRLSYEWRIAVGSAVPAASGSITVPAGQSTTVGRRVRLPCSTGGSAGRSARRLTRVRIEVSLSRPAESISYWTGCRG
jgi:hypothetical protein